LPHGEAEVGGDYASVNKITIPESQQAQQRRITWQHGVARVACTAAHGRLKHASACLSCRWVLAAPRPTTSMIRATRALQPREAPTEANTTITAGVVPQAKAKHQTLGWASLLRCADTHPQLLLSAFIQLLRAATCQTAGTNSSMLDSTPLLAVLGTEKQLRGITVMPLICNTLPGPHGSPKKLHWPFSMHTK
jgi:hypothetical protein